MKKYLVLILMLALFTTACMHHRSHRKSRSFKSGGRKVIYSMPQKVQPKQVEVPISPPDIVEIVPEPQSIIDTIPEAFVIPGEKEPEKKESGSWWFWNG